MADRDPVWSLGESQLLYSPTTGLDAAWSLGESLLLDEYVAAGGSIVPLLLYQYRARRQ
jgi:hypothetical protein